MGLFTNNIANGSLTSFLARFEQATDGSNSVAARSVLQVDGNAVSVTGQVALPTQDSGTAVSGAVLTSGNGVTGWLSAIWLKLSAALTVIVSSSATSNAITSFQATVSQTAASLPSGSLTNGIILMALSSNSGIIYVGGPGVSTANGLPLAPGAQTSLGVSNSNLVYIIGTNTSDKIAGLGN